jgi:PAS domain S-box-containing protein
MLSATRIKAASRAGGPGRSIRWYLAGLIAASILPLLCALALVLAYLQRAEVARQRSAVLSSAQRLGSLVEREMDGFVAAIQGLATSDALAKEDWAAFDRQARELAKRRGSAIALRRLDGQQIVNTYVPFGTPLPVSTDPVLRAADLKAAQTGSPVVSDLYVGAVARRLFVLVVVPVPLDGPPKYLLNMAILPEALSSLIANGTDKEAVAVVLDSRHRIIARSSDIASFIAKSASPDQIAKMQDPVGVWEGTRLDGTPILAGHVRLGSGWTVSVGIPAAVVAAPSRTAMLLMSAAVMLSAILSLALAYWGARRLQGEIRALVSPQRGDHLRANAFRLRELNDLAEELDGHERARAEARQLQDHLAAIVRSSNDAIFTIDPEGRIISWNRGAEDLLGYKPGEVSGTDIRRLLAPDDVSASVVTAMISAARKGDPFRLDTVARQATGNSVEVAVRSTPIKDAQGTLSAISVVAFEITERRRVERQRELLLRELDHRLKNVFATISSMIGLSARTASSVDNYAEGLRERIYALSAVHNLVRGAGLESAASFLELARTIGAGSFEKQVETCGPDIKLSAAAAIAFGMILNELLTNAIKYGALSRPEGRVAIDWADAGDEFRVHWRETGGPPPAPAARGNGFGTLMIKQNIAALDGQVHCDWQPAGLVVTLTCPRSSLSEPDSPGIETGRPDEKCRPR